MRRLVKVVAGWFRRRFPAKPLGRRGEDAAANFLRHRGLAIIAQSNRDRLGEIDLVGVDGRTVVFIEVKTRTSAEAGHPVDAVDATKQRRLTRLAVAFLKQHGLLEYAARFDVVAVTWPDGSRSPTIEHYANAFEAAGQGEFFS